MKEHIFSDWLKSVIPSTFFWRLKAALFGFGLSSMMKSIGPLIASSEITTWMHRYMSPEQALAKRVIVDA
jgi:hypothetical protein